MVRKPRGAQEGATPLRAAVIRGKGITATEQELVVLAERSFLDLWSYPNPYRDQKVGGTGDGKELCDLLVVCDPYVLIFSERNAAWPNRPLEISWSQWFNNAVFHSAKQTKGAERWLADYPDRVFLDRQCTRTLPIDLPPLDRRVVHRIVVARGAGNACREYFNGGTGSLVVRPDIIGDRHWNRFKYGTVEPFCVGDIDPEGSFVHVFDDGSLSFVMSELDTITDFTAYLDRKSEFVRSGKLAVAESEEDLVAYYAVRINEYGDHDFTHPDERPWSEGERIAISKTFINFIQNPQYTAKKRADEISYVWDELIKKFSGHMLDGTSLVPDGHSYDLKQSETALRYMAKENRFQRRIHGQAVVGAINIGRSAEHFFFRSMIGAPGSKGNETGFFVLVFPYLDWMEDQGGYQHYRKKRAEIAVTYGEAMLLQCSHLKRMVGVSLEPPSKDRGSSEDLLQIEQRDWTPEEQREIKDACKAMGIAQNFTENQISDQEFPELEYAPDATKQRELGPNRKERRKAKAQSLKRNQKKR